MPVYGLSQADATHKYDNLNFSNTGSILSGANVKKKEVKNH